MFSRFSLIPGRGCGEARVQPLASSRANIIPSGRLRLRAQPLLLVTPNATSYLRTSFNSELSLKLLGRQYSVP